MKIAVSAESTCDLSKDLIEKYDVKIIPYHVILGEEEYQDDGSLSSQELFEFVDKNGILPKTAALTVGEYEDYFKNIIFSDLESTDNTEEIVKRLSEEYECLKVISWKECKDIIDNVDQN